MKPIFLTLLVIAISTTAGCKPSQPSAEYLATCEGPPLRTAERRDQAMQDGYEIDRRYDCITKRSAVALAEQKARWEAANTPEAKAARQAEFDRHRAEQRAGIEARVKASDDARAERDQRIAAAEAVPIDSAEINSATEAQLMNLEGLGGDTVHQILTERAKMPFKGWEDVVWRVVGLSAAETSVRASAFGLTVNGRSLEGAEPGSELARLVRIRWMLRKD